MKLVVLSTERRAVHVYELVLISVLYFDRKELKALTVSARHTAF